MKRIAILIITLSLYCQNGLAQNDTTKVGPQLTFLNTILDYDTIERYSNGVRTFVFYNTGDEPLVITRVKSGCSCTVPSYSQDTIMPGGRGEIKAGYNTKKPGNFNRDLTVSSNATNVKNQKIYIKGFVLDTKKIHGIEPKL